MIIVLVLLVTLVIITHPDIVLYDNFIENSIVLLILYLLYSICIKCHCSIVVLKKTKTQITGYSPRLGIFWQFAAKGSTTLIRLREKPCM